ncbi:MAG: hypothetical protein CME63_03660 [Halobacteriovoraceae bacterium]|nr:hypothetical protein [Halobacteriovoraceae bacterium]MBC96819.1 hypothetical protein [Halobacteriovoraceae bacterium]|tara:strand:- start:115432 stop:116421 length:990 start_codon:yes stop_codon:yes gene_type:complete
MNSPSHKFLDNKYWKLISTIDSLNQDVSFTELISHMGIQYTVEDIEEVVTFLKKFGHPIKIENKTHDAWIILTGKKPQFKMNISLSEWLAMQAHFPLLDENKGKAIYNTLANCLNRLENKYPNADFYQYMDEERTMGELTRELGHDKEKLLKAVNEVILKDEQINLETKDKRNFDIFVHKVVYIDGVLSIIGEETNDRCLTCVDIDEIEAYRIEGGSDYRANYASAEVDDFISAVRAISGNEQRLVMKVSAPEKVNLNPDFHFLGNPFVTTNTEGEFIWAASVEVSNELYKWLATIYSEIDIIDPSSVKEELEHFMEQKESLKHLKKAS